MNVWKRIAVAALATFLLLPAAGAAAGTKRPRPSDVPGAQTSIAPNDFQVYNDYASPERTYASRHAVVHYVAVGIDAPPVASKREDPLAVAHLQRTEDPELHGAEPTSPAMSFHSSAGPHCTDEGGTPCRRSPRS